MILPGWGERSPEEANHFNPAFCGALIYEFVRSYTKARESPPAFALIFCALPVALHPGTRELLPRTTITGLFPWLEAHPDAKVGYLARAKNLAPYVREALRYAAARRAISFVTGGLVALGDKRASFSDQALQGTTTEVRETVAAIRKVAKWFAAAGDTPTILGGWGIRV